MIILKNVMASSRMRMVLAGGFSVLSAYIVFLLFVWLGAHYQIASVANFVTYCVINFTLNRLWAFKSTGSLAKQAFLHFDLHLGNQIMIMAGLYILVETFSFQAAWAQLIMQIFATLLVFFLTPLIFTNRTTAS